MRQPHAAQSSKSHFSGHLLRFPFKPDRKWSKERRTLVIKTTKHRRLLTHGAQEEHLRAEKWKSSREEKWKIKILFRFKANSASSEVIHSTAYRSYLSFMFPINQNPANCFESDVTRTLPSTLGLIWDSLFLLFLAKSVIVQEYWTGCRCILATVTVWLPEMTRERISRNLKCLQFSLLRSKFDLFIIKHLQDFDHSRNPAQSKETFYKW